jgi:acyl dehydratase
LRRPEVGEELPTLEVEITREQISRYAEASGDRNPIHLDEEFARSVGLPGVIAHGMLDMGLMARMVSSWAGDHRRLTRLRCRFAGMVRPGDRVSFGGRVTGVGEELVELEVWAKNQEGQLVLSKGEAALRLA